MRFELREYNYEDNILRFRFIPTAQTEKDLFNEINSGRCRVNFYSAECIEFVQPGVNND